jgi:hypothetical protein
VDEESIGVDWRSTGIVLFGSLQLGHHVRKGAIANLSLFPGHHASELASFSRDDIYRSNPKGSSEEAIAGSGETAARQMSQDRNSHIDLLAQPAEVRRFHLTVPAIVLP